MNIMQLLVDSGINAFGAQLLAESYKKLKPAVKEVIPNPLVFPFEGVETTLRDSPEKKEG